MSQALFHNQYVSKKSKQTPLPWIYQLLKPFEEHRYTAIKKILSDGQYDHCLDVGCGSADFLFANQSRFKKVTGIDLVPQLIQRARKKKFTIPHKFYRFDAGSKKLPARRNTFDVVISIATLQYLNDLDLFFMEIFRVLKPGGVFIFEVPNFLVIWRRFQLLTGIFPSTSLFHEQWDGGVVHYFTHNKLESFIHSHQFTIKQVTCSGIFSSVRKLHPSMLGANLIFVCQKPR